MTSLPEPERMWMDGSLVDWNDAKVHVWTDVVQRAASVFEGIRGYWHEGDRRHRIVHWDQHVERLRQSARLARIPIEISDQGLWDALVETIDSLGYREDIYIRPTVYLRSGRFAARPATSDAGIFMPVFISPRDPNIESGLTCTVSSWRRPNDDSMPARMKAAANYFAIRLARIEAQERGYDEAILLTADGHVSETGGAAVFVVRGDQISTPRITDSILESITRSTVIGMLADLGTPVVERQIDRSELYLATEIFLVGTLAEITSVSEIDGFRLSPNRSIADGVRRQYAHASRQDEAPGPWIRMGPEL